ncbi:ATP-grasp domain-containing protein [Arhodomonas sp. AD133]|uniref:ATP-grasp domain-containing protein n=1 Tax=Arhodomonas sp. AD133 TaxID=3415009 RepID=UPI003EB7F529
MNYVGRRNNDQRPRVLILGDQQCEHVQAVAHALENLRAQPVIFDSRRFPAEATISYDPQGEISLSLSGCRYRMSDFRSVYWRSYLGVDPVKIGDNAVDRVSQRDSQSLLESLLHAEGPAWFNGYEAWAMHRIKPVQFRHVAQLGIPTPRTLMTNDPETATTFSATCKPLIHKPVFGGSRTRKVTDELMDRDRLTRVFRSSPVTLQQCVEGTNLRTFVIGESVFSVEIEATTLDFRADPTHRLIWRNTPEQIAQWSRQICHRLHMRWTAIDWRIDEKGKLYFLEANPSPMFVGLSRKVGLDVADHLARAMVDAEPTG